MPPTASRRLALRHLSKAQAQHPGLWLDKFLATQLRREEPVEKSDITQLIKEVTGLAVPDTYKLFFPRWKRTLEAMQPAAEGSDQTLLLATATTDGWGRLAVGLGSESVLETNITLHHTYGVPYIPGSALKGLAAAYARKYLTKEWEQGGEAYQTLFGDTTLRGCVTFFDALYDPASSHADHPLFIDVLTVHHPGYYRGEPEAAPADWDNPNPVSFVSAAGNFLVALQGPKAWAESAYEILKMALADEGVGAKTASGYGRLTLTIGSTPVSSAQQEPNAQLPYALQRQQLLKEALSAGRMRGTITEVKGAFAFINPAGGGGKVFVHQSQTDAPPLREGQIVEYAIGPGREPGRTQAVQVKVLLQPNR